MSLLTIIHLDCFPFMGRCSKEPLGTFRVLRLSSSPSLHPEELLEFFERTQSYDAFLAIFFEDYHC